MRSKNFIIKVIIDKKMQHNIKLTNVIYINFYFKILQNKKSNWIINSKLLFKIII